MSQSIIPQKRSVDAQEAAWVADEDRFVLQQTKRKAALRIKGGRAQPIDWLAVTLALVEPGNNFLDNELEDMETAVKNPEAVFENLNKVQLSELERAIDGYLALERSRSNREYWATMKMICQDRHRNLDTSEPGARRVTAVASDLDRLLGPKTLAELEVLEKQIEGKLASREPIDTDYWEHLLKCLLTYKAKAKLRRVSETLLRARRNSLLKEQCAKASEFKAKANSTQTRKDEGPAKSQILGDRLKMPAKLQSLDPEPSLRLRPEEKALPSVDEATYTSQLTEAKKNMLQHIYIPRQERSGDPDLQQPMAKRHRAEVEQPAQSSTSQFDREVARGLGDNEEIMTTEVKVETKNKSQWAHLHRPRKPKYFNRIQLGYEWNKYNQTHYDHENPPPKVVQGYKFNIFYPDLVDVTRAPTYRIERENGRKRGQTLAPAGEDDTCLIRFTAGPPYEDIAFRIIDREWDFSAKRERGFRSSFDKGILQLHFQFKKIYYRK